MLAHPLHRVGRSGHFMAAMLCAAAITPAHALTIDSFSDGLSTLEVPTMPVPASGYLQSDTAASVPGGVRRLVLQPQAGSGALAWVGVGADPTRRGLSAYRLETQALYASFGYGLSNAMNLDLSGQSALRLDVLWGGAQPPAGAWDRDGLELTVYATTSTGVGLNPDGSAAQATLRGASVVDLSFASFSTNSSTGRPVNWADVDSLLFVVSEATVGATAAGFGIVSVSAVPEPASWGLMGAGLLALALRRRAAASR